MSFEFDAILDDMLGAMRDELGSGWQDLQGYALEVFNNNKASLSKLVKQYKNGDLTEDEFKSELEDEKDTLASEFAVLAVISKASAQRAINAALNVLKQAVNTVV